MAKNPKFYRSDFYSEMQRYQWEDEIIKALNLGYLKNRQVLTLMKLSSAMNWAKHKGELRWSNEKACQRVGLAQSTFYRNNKEILLSGFLGRRKGNYFAKYPSSDEIQRYLDHLDKETRKKELERKKQETSNPYENEIDPWS